MNLLRLIILFSAVMLLSSCSSDGEERPEYLDSYSVSKLEIPPQLSRPDNNEELHIPKPSAKILQELKNRESVEGSVSPAFKGIELQSDGDMYWLLINKDADDAWPMLEDFLGHEGIKIYRNEPLLGFIETEWVKEYEFDRDAGFFGELFGSFSADLMDKFRLRLERMEGKEQTKLYVSHRGLEIVVTNDGTSWQQTAANKMLEKELLYRMVLFAGLTAEEAEEAFAGYKPYQIRIRRVGEVETSEYEITGSKGVVWRRVVQALDRMGANVINSSKEEGALEIQVSNVADELVEEKEVDDSHPGWLTDIFSDDGEVIEDEKDEIAESSWLMAWFSGDDEKETAKEKTPENGEATKDGKNKLSVFIDLTESNNSTLMQLSLKGDEKIINGLAEKFRRGLVGLLK